MSSAPLADTFGRVHRDLRISITDRCDLRCAYCMPAEGLEWAPSEAVLTAAELERLARIAVQRCGVTSVRVTGGEPLVRPDVVEIVARLSQLGVPVALTTNGTMLERKAAALADAGLSRVNVSCDSLDAERFAELTGRDRLERVLAGIALCVQVGLEPVKVNVVLIRGVNDGEIADWVRFGRSAGVVVRFIEFMPLEAHGVWQPDSVVPFDEVVASVATVADFDIVDEGSDPARRLVFTDGLGEVGVIASVSRSFCSSCDRVRLTSTGEFRNCLFAVDGTDLRAALRSGCSDSDIEAMIRAAVFSKAEGHGVGTPTFIRPRLSMSQIGG